jgi:hypothetical protein
MRLLRAVCAIALLATAAPAATLRVPADHATLIEALDVAADLDTVLVAPGTYSYTETRTLQLWDGPRAVTSLGFVNGDVVVMSEGGPGATTLEPAAAGGSQGVLVVSATTVCRIEGFRIVVPSQGTGIWGDTGTLEVNDCDFESAQPQDGWGVFRTYGSSVVDQCTFDGLESAVVHHGASLRLLSSVVSNCSGVFGAVHVTPGPYPYINPLLTVRDCEFRNNHGSFWAGAVSGASYAIQGETYSVDADVTDCVFTENTSDGDGGACRIQGTAYRNVFLRNSAGGAGGALHLSQTGYVAWNTFHANSSSGGTGSALRVSGSSLIEVHRNIFSSQTGFLAFAAVQASNLVQGCNIFWNNLAGDLNVPLDATDLQTDPLYCNAPLDDLTVAANSPANWNAGCGQIGALGSGCGGVSIESESWGRIKGRYRD